MVAFEFDMENEGVRHNVPLTLLQIQSHLLSPSGRGAQWPPTGNI